jgi:hypothetical protein
MRALRETTDVDLTVAAGQQVPFTELRLPSQGLPAGFVSPGLQVTANATTGKNRMPSCLLDGALAKLAPVL